MISKGKIIEPENSSSHSANDIKEGISKSNRPKEEYILMTSEIQMTSDLKAYVFPKARNPFPVKFKYKKYEVLIIRKTTTTINYKLKSKLNFRSSFLLL